MSQATGVMLVTGGSGFLGQRVINQLTRSGQPVRALLRPGADPGGLRPLWEEGAASPVEVVHASFNDTQALERALQNVGTVLHIAASKKGSASAQVANTVVGSDNLFQAALNARISRLVLVSSLGVLGTNSLPRGGEVDENVPLEPHPEWRDPYTFAKLRQEQLAWKYHRESGLPLVVIRPGVIFGPGQTILSARIGLSLFGLFLHLGGGNPIPLTYVDNCADAIIAAANPENDLVGQAFCVVDDSLPTSRALLKRYRREVRPLRFVPVPWAALRLVARLNVAYTARTNGHIPAVFTPYRVRASWKGQQFSNNKAKQGLGWRPRVSMQEALDRTFTDESQRLGGRPKARS